MPLLLIVKILFYGKVIGMSIGICLRCIEIQQETGQYVEMFCQSLGFPRFALRLVMFSFAIGLLFTFQLTIMMKASSLKIFEKDILEHQLPHSI